MGRRNKRGRRKDVSLAMIAANNHYAGFGPGTANLFRKMVGLPELSWENQRQIQENVQQQHKLEQQQDQQIRNLKTSSKNDRKRRQSSLVEFMK
jgi:Spy/CpxP family protein refolding chaperone